MNDDKNAQVAVGQVKKMMASLQRQPPLAVIKDLISSFKHVNTKEAEDMLGTAEILYGTTHVMKKVPLVRRGDLYAGTLLKEWKDGELAQH